MSDARDETPRRGALPDPDVPRRSGRSRGARTEAREGREVRSGHDRILGGRDLRPDRGRRHDDRHSGLLQEQPPAQGVPRHPEQHPPLPPAEGDQLHRGRREGDRSRDFVQDEGVLPPYNTSGGAVLRADGAVFAGLEQVHRYIPGDVGEQRGVRRVEARDDIQVGDVLLGHRLVEDREPSQLPPPAVAGDLLRQDVVVPACGALRGVPGAGGGRLHVRVPGLRGQTLPRGVRVMISIGTDSGVEG